MWTPLAGSAPAQLALASAGQERARLTGRACRSTPVCSTHVVPCDAPGAGARSHTVHSRPAQCSLAGVRAGAGGMAPECSCSPISDSPPRRLPALGRREAASAAPAECFPALAPAVPAAGATAKQACPWALARADVATVGSESRAGAAPAAWAGACGSDPAGRPAVKCGELLAGMRLGPAAPVCAAWGGPNGGRRVVCRLAPAPPPHFVGVRAAAAEDRGGCGGAVLRARLGAPSRRARVLVRRGAPICKEGKGKH